MDEYLMPDALGSPAGEAGKIGTASGKWARREWLGGLVGGTAAAISAGSVGQAWAAAQAGPAVGATGGDPPRPERSPFLLALNTGSIMGYKLDVPAQIDLAAEAGYQGVELWLRDVERFVASGGEIAELRKRLDDRGLVVVGGINFHAWASGDDAQRQAALEAMRRDMDWIAALGGTAIAAAPAGINQPPPADLRQVGERYRALLQLGEKHGVVPQLEIWGASATLSRVSEALFVAAEAGHPQAQLLLDVFHMYKGGSSPESLRLIHGQCMTNFHMNDYPADPPRETIRDSHRVFPGDGVGPVTKILQLLAEIGFRGALSLELFNAEYWKRPALEMAKEGLEKMKSAVAAAFAS